MVKIGKAQSDPVMWEFQSVINYISVHIDTTLKLPF